MFQLFRPDVMFKLVVQVIVIVKRFRFENVIIPKPFRHGDIIFKLFWQAIRRHDVMFKRFQNHVTVMFTLFACHGNVMSPGVGRTDALCRLIWSWLSSVGFPPATHAPRLGDTLQPVGHMPVTRRAVRGKSSDIAAAHGHVRGPRERRAGVRVAHATRCTATTTTAAASAAAKTLVTDAT